MWIQQATRCMNGTVPSSAPCPICQMIATKERLRKVKAQTRKEFKRYDVEIKSL